MHEPLRRSDFIETPNGNCRLSSSLCSKLSETAPTWGNLVAPWAEYVARALWTTTARPKIPATRLTQQHRREAKASPPLPPETKTPRRQESLSRVRKDDQDWPKSLWPVCRGKCHAKPRRLCATRSRGRT